MLNLSEFRHHLRDLLVVPLLALLPGLLTATEPITTEIAPPSWLGDAVPPPELITARDARIIEIPAGQVRWLRVQNPWGSVPGGDPEVYGPTRPILRVSTERWMDKIDTVLAVYIHDAAGSFRQVTGPYMDDRSYPDDCYSLIEFEMQPGDEVYIGIYEYYGNTATTQVLVDSIQATAPSPSYIEVAPHEAIPADTRYVEGSIAEYETRRFAFQIPESGMWDFRTMETAYSSPEDITTMTVYTVVGNGPQQLHTQFSMGGWFDTNWAAVSEWWVAGTWVIIEVQGWNNHSVQNFRLVANQVYWGG
jgi:hypothetical protein